VADRVRGPSFAKCADPRYSPDGETLAYFAAVERPSPRKVPKVQLVVNGKPSDVIVAEQGPISFGAERGAWAAAALARIEPPPGTPSPVPTSTAAGSAIATPTAAGKGAASPTDPAEGAATAMPGATPGPDPTKGSATPSPVATEDAAAAPPHRIVVFDATGVLGEHPDTTAPAVSPDGAHVAYIAADEDGRQVLHVDGRVRRDFGAPEIAHQPSIKMAKAGPNLEPETTVRYLSDGSLVGVALGEAGWTVFHDDEIWATYPALRMPPESDFQVDNPNLRTTSAIVAGSLSVATDTPTACWWERMEGENDRWRVLCNRKPIDSQVCEVQSPGVPISIGAKSGRAAYICRSTPVSEEMELGNTPQNIWVVVNGKKLGPHRFVWALELSDDGEHYGYAAADSLDEPWFYVIDGKRYDGPWQQTFPPKFSPDGTVAVWAASAEEEGSRVDLVLRGNIVTRAERVMKPPLFFGSGEDLEVHWAVKRGNSVRRVIASGIGAPTAATDPAPAPSASQR
jgi:hypothetical protein